MADRPDPPPGSWNPHTAMPGPTESINREILVSFTRLSDGAPIAIELREQRGVPGFEVITLEHREWAGSRRFLFRHEAVAWAAALRRQWGRR
jgi:hypothetical protein